MLVNGRVSLGQKLGWESLGIFPRRSIPPLQTCQTDPCLALGSEPNNAVVSHLGEPNMDGIHLVCNQIRFRMGYKVPFALGKSESPMVCVGD